MERSERTFCRGSSPKEGSRNAQRGTSRGLLRQVRVERPTYELNRRLRLQHQDASIDAEHPIPEPSQYSIPPRVSAAPALVVAAIDLNHEAGARYVEISDEAPGERHLPAKHDAEPPGADETKQHGLRRRRRRPHLPSAKCEERRARRFVPSLHGDLRSRRSSRASPSRRRLYDARPPYRAHP
jgi:hypothetical protein